MESRLKEEYERLNTEHTLDDLKKEKIDDNDVSEVKKYIKSLKFSLGAGAIILFILDIFIGYGLFSDINNLKEIANVNDIVITIIYLCFVLLLFHIIKLFFITKYSKIKKSQYGVINRKYSQTSSSSNSKSKRKYYLVVDFPDDVIIKGINCRKEDYLNLSEGDKVLVFTFDKTRAYAISPK